jgi:hypothetical protein
VLHLNLQALLSVTVKLVVDACASLSAQLEAKLAIDLHAKITASAAVCLDVDAVVDLAVAACANVHAGVAAQLSLLGLTVNVDAVVRLLALVNSSFWLL